jgi:hypothetical protein
MTSRFCLRLLAVAFWAIPSLLLATPYASSPSLSGTSVSFILNEPADSLTYRINGGSPVTLDGTTIGLKNFTLGSPTDTFSISAQKNSATGFTIPASPSSMTLGTETNGWKAATTISGTSYIHDENNPLTRFNSPRGVSVSLNPNAANFGLAYVSNSALPTTFAARPGLTTAGEGIFALKADGSDAFNYGDTGQNPILEGLPAFSNAGANSPFRVTVNSQGDVLVADFYDNNSNAFILNQNLTTAQNFFPSYVGTNGALPVGQNHGSTTAVYSTGSLAGGNLVLYTLDEDLSTEYLADGTQPGTDRNSLWRYNIGAGPLPSSVIPTKVNVSNNLLATATSDLDFGADGKIYVAQNRSGGLEGGIFVLDSAGNTLFNSLTASRTLLNDNAAPDIFAQTLAISVSPDQKWLAVMINRSDVGVIPLVNGIPDIANRLIAITTTTNTENTGRDIAFDAAGNIHYVSSGQSRYRVLAPGGNTLTTLAWNGSAYSFTSGPVATEDADFDNDGDVDGGDLLIWQTGLGTNSGATNGQGDANGNGVVDATDLGIWQAKFGQGAATAVAGAVPEPTTLGMAALSLTGLLAIRRRQVV